ncbi:MAG TPA: hypothetical protein VFN73_11015 [Propionibacteriaceae bacterium]|nr:hypothetical protein [Propionibacteriaceae bacterium]
MVIDAGATALAALDADAPGVAAPEAEPLAEALLGAPEALPAGAPEGPGAEYTD